MLAPLASASPVAVRQVDAVVFLLVGLLGGAHCLGMCGPLVSVYADRMAGDRDALTLAEVRQHLLFNVGRTAGYALVGGLVAGAGALAVGAMDVFAVGAVVRGAIGVLAGGFVAATGVTYVRGSAGHPSLPVVGSAFRRVSALLTSRVDAFVDDGRIAALGAIHALLPCPITYPAYVYAFAVADPLRGAALLALVGVGTMPTLLAYGTVFGSVSGGRRLQRVLGAAFVVLGYMTISHGLAALGVSVPRLPLPMPMPGPRLLK